MEYALEGVPYFGIVENVGLNPCSNGICSRSISLWIPREIGIICLNPCSNGICSRSAIQLARKALAVLILVLMEYALEGSHRQLCYCPIYVLILVLMEYALEDV